MKDNLKFRWYVTIAITIVGLLYILPNLTDSSKFSWLPNKKLTMGLDIQGGIHLVMGVDVATVIKERTTRMVKNLQADFTDSKIAFQSVDEVDGEEVTIKISSTELDKIKTRLNEGYGTVLQVTEESQGQVTVKFFDAYILQMKKEIVDQAIQVIRNRIDEFGVAEPSITAQGTDRILVQLPGIKDSAGAKDLINRTAKLDFRVVSNEMDPVKLEEAIKSAEEKGNFKLGVGHLGYQEYIKRLNADLKNQLPAMTRIVFEKLENADSLEQGRRAMLVRTDVALNGSELEDAAVRPDEYGKPEVTFQFSVDGRRLFAELTEKAAGGFLAIVLDDVVKSAPSVKERIDSESARITLGSGRDYNATLKEAQFITTSLRAGSLPAGLTQLEERTVGPTMGADAIAKGERATLIACLFVFAFMLAWYKGMGLVADITLAMNLLLTVAGLSAIGATLTLPGVAGLALTVGMAVDANIIIFERIREEFLRTQNTLSAVRKGFDSAFSAIFDSNITTILTCVVLIYFGTGPIRGFAVSLTIGLIVSLFTSVFVARTLMETAAKNFNWKLKLTPAKAQ
jgi:preprotein translocase subunit SecD